MSERPWSDWTTVCSCATCGRVLMRSRSRDAGIIPDGQPYAGMPGEEKEYAVRPWAALVINRKRAVDYDEKTGKGVGALRMPDGSEVTITERPTVCSQACLDGLHVSWARCSDSDVSDLYPATIKIGDDLLSRVLGSRGPIPPKPSDEWLDPIDRERFDPLTGAAS